MFDQWFKTNRGAVTSWLHDLHAHPETGFEEVRTAAFVAERLAGFGLEVATGIGGTGVVGTRRGRGASAACPGRQIGFRAELDALPMQEKADIAYRSAIDGQFHGCGHDGHTVTALAGAAQKLLGGQEDEMHRAIEVARAGEVGGGHGIGRRHQRAHPRKRHGRIAAVDAVYQTMVADWIEAAKAAGVADPAAMLAFYRQTYAELAGQQTPGARLRTAAVPGLRPSEMQGDEMLGIAWKLRRAVETLIAVFMIAMVALTFVDVIGRRLVGKPIYGANDITEHLMALVVFSGLPLVTAAAAHLTVDILDKLVMAPWMRWWRILASVLVAVVLGLLAWLFVRQGLTVSAISEVSQALRVPRAPLYFFMAASCALSAMASLVVAFAARWSIRQTPTRRKRCDYRPDRDGCGQPVRRPGAWASTRSAARARSACSCPAGPRSQPGRQTVSSPRAGATCSISLGRRRPERIRAGPLRGSIARPRRCRSTRRHRWPSGRPRHSARRRRVACEGSSHGHMKPEQREIDRLRKRIEKL
ncbi:MAG: TRAP transporter small permease subunit [Thermohalobaculum sp.]|nr:TRAP transporter small permease subunit [Thermohalobaculum sp.]